MRKGRSSSAPPPGDREPEKAEDGPCDGRATHHLPSATAPGVCCADAPTMVACRGVSGRARRRPTPEILRGRRPITFGSENEPGFLPPALVWDQILVYGRSPRADFAHEATGLTSRTDAPVSEGVLVRRCQRLGARFDAGPEGFLADRRLLTVNHVAWWRAESSRMERGEVRLLLSRAPAAGYTWLAGRMLLDTWFPEVLARGRGWPGSRTGPFLACCLLPRSFSSGSPGI